MRSIEVRYNEVVSTHITKAHNKNLLLYHIVCPARYRRDIFSESVVHTLKQSCFGITACYEIHFVEIGADDDHVHFLTQSIPTMSPSEMVQKIKSLTAREIFKYHKEVKQKLWGGHLWTKGYYVASVGARGSATVIAEYVKNQGKEYVQYHQQQPTLFDGLA